MAIARTGVFVDDYLEYASTLPAELQRLLNTIRELDDRSQCMRYLVFILFVCYTYTTC
ncbi:putative inhibitor of growth histone-binding protein [Helianthus annuus]|nr:putative inhibitor of growth histone-binding protein [Helianthus annuus]